MKSLILFFAPLCAALMCRTFNVTADDVIRKGVSVDSVDISGMTEREAKSAVGEYADGIRSVEVNLDINGQTAVTTAGNLGYRQTGEDVIDEALNLGKKGNVIRRYKDELDIDRSGRNFELEMSVSEEAAVKALEKLCDEYNVGAKNASLKLTSSGFTIIPGQTGVTVDYKKTASNLCRYLNEEWDKKSGVEAKAVTKVEKPKYTAKDCENVSDTPIGSYTTNFSAGSSYYNRNKNIENGARLLDGAVIYPDETYSLNDHLAPWTEDNGYYAAGTYVDGGVEDSLGGGICQVSSTLYNALLLAEIDIVERYPHSMTVGYVPLSQDAALAGDYKDLVFRNNTDAPLYIESVYLNGSITFNVYGHDTADPGRTVEYVSEKTGTISVKTEVKKDSSKPEDYEKVVEPGHVGYTARLWKYVYQDGEEVEKTQVNSSTYRMTPRQVIRGTKKEEETKKPKKNKDDKGGENYDGEEADGNENDAPADNDDSAGADAGDRDGAAAVDSPDNGAGADAGDSSDGSAKTDDGNA